ncbi:MAG: DUF4912 domain-containing protein [Candidatus Omnitrophica bacterium]|nr:DUF4912 domain-containing protein [Candidatus Omnitrophota bacterium]
MAKGKIKKVAERKNSQLEPVAKRKMPGRKDIRAGVASKIKSIFDKSGSNNTFVAVSAGEQVVEESKFFVSSEPMPATALPDTSKKESYKEHENLPQGYQDNLIVIQVRDPYWLYAYWEVTAQKIDEVRKDIKDLAMSAKRILRIYQVKNEGNRRTNLNRLFDIEITNDANNWYINAGIPNTTYCVDIGLLLGDGRFIVLARSNVVHTPLDGPSSVTDEEWMIVEDDFNRLYGLSAGLGIGLSSLELRKRIKERLLSPLASGILSSPVKKKKKGLRQFWLVVDTELIVYGATEPDAIVTVAGKPVKLKKDGTFSVRFHLPDGKLDIPVRAVSQDKQEERIITPKVRKKTV